jgi:DNA mismatch endonuclease (patch repair protein)
MADNLRPEARSRNMAAIVSKHTRPELAVRKLVHALGYRYRLHVRTLPGKPDLVFTSRRKVIEVKGCFWHHHSCKEGQRVPLSNRDYWQRKIARNVERDAENERLLKKQGWMALLIWECEVKNAIGLRRRIKSFLRKREERSRN